MTSSPVDAAARIAELERQLRDLQHQLAAREGALRELAARLRSLEPLDRPAVPRPAVPRPAVPRPATARQ